jgi:hypothetical protein
MIQFTIRELRVILIDLEWREESLRDYPPTTAEKMNGVVESLIEFIKRLVEIAVKVELIETVGCCDRFIRSLENSIHPFELVKGCPITLDTFTPKELVRELKGIKDAAEKELRLRKFAFIPTAKDKFFEQEKLFGDGVYSAFPSARDEIKAAGNCLAADLNTAAIFHFMRAVETVMRVFVVHLGIKVKNKTIKEAGWDELVKLIKKKLKERREKYDNSKRKKRSELNDLKFYGVAADELNVFKENWRDKVMHTWSPYNEHDAQTVLVRVRDFMQKLSMKVSEINN